jgi:carboxymethylenebutenolidase
VARRRKGGDDAGMTDISLPYFSAHPADERPGPGVVVIHEANGISPQLLRISQRLAAQGYRVVTPDLFFRSGGSEAADYTTLVASLDEAQALADLEGLAALLRSQGATSVGVTGFCMGGTWSWRCATAGEGFDAAVGFYGSGVAKDLRQPKCPALMMFGGADPWIPIADAEAVAAFWPDTVIYPDATHGFMRDGSEDYHPEAASDAWDRLTSFFAEHLH